VIDPTVSYQPIPCSLRSKHPLGPALFVVEP